MPVYDSSAIVNVWSCPSVISRGPSDTFKVYIHIYISCTCKVKSCLHEARST